MDKETTGANAERGKKGLLYKIGLGLLLVSGVLWLAPFTVPFAPFSTKTKAVLITGALVLAEALFWIGALIVGKEAAKRFRKYLNPKNWRRHRPRQGADENE